jgi:hypothetical protein
MADSTHHAGRRLYEDEDEGSEENEEEEEFDDDQNSGSPSTIRRRLKMRNVEDNIGKFRKTSPSPGSPRRQIVYEEGEEERSGSIKKTKKMDMFIRDANTSDKPKRTFTEYMEQDKEKIRLKDVGRTKTMEDYDKNNKKSQKQSKSQFPFPSKTQALYAILAVVLFLGYYFCIRTSTDESTNPNGNVKADKINWEQAQKKLLSEIKRLGKAFPSQTP